MKKLMTILVVFAMCGTAMAQMGWGGWGGNYGSNKPYDLSMDTETTKTTETVGGYNISKDQYEKLSFSEKQYVTTNGRGKDKTYYYKEHQVTTTTTDKVATLHDYTNANGTTGLTYTVTRNNGNVNSQYASSNYISQLYFSTKDMNLNEGEVLAVQFMGAEISAHGASMENFDILDYGIYLYDPNQDISNREYMSIGANNNYFEIGTEQNFGVYYVNKQGDYITSTENFVANYDGDDHEITIYSETIDGVTTEYPDGETRTTSKRYMCMLEQEQFVHPHWEFMLQTTIDNPYYGVNPEEFQGNGSTDVTAPNGQPLPGTLATILISGLCAGALRKRNKK